MIGDPSGKSQERVLLSREQIEQNVAGIRAQLARFLDFDAAAMPARIVNNADWLGDDRLLSFLRDAGKHFTVNYMLQKESVNRRLESEDGISFTEFSYLLLQAYDFLQLFDATAARCRWAAAISGATSPPGIDLIRKLRAKKAHGLVMPLVTTASGVKFGKTETGAVWLDPARTSPYAFYQFWLNTDDRDVVRYLKSLHVPRARDDRGARARDGERAPEKREAQRVLAREVTTLVHGAEQVARAEHASQLLFGEDITQLLGRGCAGGALRMCRRLSSPAANSSPTGIGIVDLVARVRLAPSKSEARRLVQSGGVYSTTGAIADVQARITRGPAIGGRVFVVRKGTEQNHVVRIVAEE